MHGILKKLVGVALIVWEPLNFASEVLGVLPTLVYRGATAAVELALHGAIAALAAAGGLALLHERAHARTLATVAVFASGLRTIQSLYWSTLPGNTIPGDEWLHATVTIAAALLAIAAINLGRPAPR